MVLRDPRAITWLLNVYKHLQKDYDYLLVIVGDTGTGKSVFALQLLETWYKIILKEEFNKNRVTHINSDYEAWLKKFQTLKAYDMNIYDEGGTALDSKDFMTKMSKDISKLFNVFRAKRFFSVIVLPNYFNLNKYFRENRLRGLVFIKKRGRFNLYSKKQINALNAHFNNKALKTLDYWKPTMFGAFSDYKGVIRKAYDKQKMDTIDKLLDQTINSTVSNKAKNFNFYDLYHEKVSGYLAKGLTSKVMAEKLDINIRTVQRIVATLKAKKMLK